ncbi:MAG: hypothetical protein ABL966_14525 [Acidimicrobiales bacterium]
MPASSDQAVVVSWTKDRARFRPAALEMPILRRLRRTVQLIAALFGGTAALLALGGVPGWAVGWMALPPFFLATFYVVVRWSTLREVGTGTLTWHIDGRGIRVEGTTATEIPWAQMARWYRRAGHLMVEVRRPNGHEPHQGAAAPLTAFDEAAWSQAEGLLTTHLGPEA